MTSNLEYINVARHHLNEMDEAESERELNQAALSAMTATISALDGSGPYMVLASLLAHITIMQPDPQAALTWVLEGVQAGWQAAAKVNQQ